MSDDRYIKEMVANGAILTIEKLIEHYNMGDETLYGTILEIGRVCDTYHKVLQTGNSVECAEVVTYDNGIEYLDLSVRTYNVLKRNRINTIYELIDYGYGELSKLHYMGKNTMNEIIRKLSEKGYSLKEGEEK